MGRALDDQELGAEYRGSLPQAPEDLIPDAVEDPDGYLKYANERINELSGSMRYFDSKIKEVKIKCIDNKHRDADGKSMLVPCEVPYQSTHVRCRRCDLQYTIASACQYFGYDDGSHVTVIHSPQAPVAQLDPERRSTNPEAAGSNPAGRTQYPLYDEGSYNYDNSSITFTITEGDTEKVLRRPYSGYFPPPLSRSQGPSIRSIPPGIPRRINSGYRGTRNK